MVKGYEELFKTALSLLTQVKCAICIFFTKHNRCVCECHLKKKKNGLLDMGFHKNTNFANSEQEEMNGHEEQKFSSLCYCSDSHLEYSQLVTHTQVFHRMNRFGHLKQAMFEEVYLFARTSNMYFCCLHFCILYFSCICCIS